MEPLTTHFLNSSGAVLNPKGSANLFFFNYELRIEINVENFFLNVTHKSIWADGFTNEITAYFRLTQIIFINQDDDGIIWALSQSNPQFFEYDIRSTKRHPKQEEIRELVQIQQWLKNPAVVEHFPCEEVKLNGFMYKSNLIITTSDLVVLREVQDQKGVAEVIVKRPLSAIVKITAKKRHPELITFKYGIPDGENLIISDMDRFLIPNADKATKVVSEQILKQLKNREC